MSAAAAPDEVGPHIAGLEFRRRIGTGGYADVFLYRETSLDRDVAVKVVRETGLSEDEATGFVAEAHAMAHLAHPHIVPVYAVGRAAHGRPYLTMPFYPEGTLFDRARRPLAVPEVLKTGVQIGSAVAYAHGAGILHRDIKPHNILRNQFGPALSDFGIAGTIADVGEREVGVSIPWAPPEVLADRAAPGVASDVYSLAATLWHLLAAHAPFERAGDSEAALVRRIHREPLPAAGAGGRARHARAPAPPVDGEGPPRPLLLDDEPRARAPGRAAAAPPRAHRRGPRARTSPVGRRLRPGGRRPGPFRGDPAAAGPGRRRGRRGRRRHAGAGAVDGAETPSAVEAGVTGSTTLTQARTRTTVVLLVLVLVMAAVLLLGVLMLVLRGPGGAG